MAAPARNVPENVVQDYLESLVVTNVQPSKRLRKVLTSYAELRYRLDGGGKCKVCGASVRHVIPVKAEHVDGSISEFACLCTRCMEAERAISDRVTLTVGKAVLVYERKEQTKTQKFPAYRQARGA
ncbi:MAG: hypothetical protein ACRD3E_18065 [Terriglobales bacterium]